jgi:hypothetical protein
MIRQGTRVLSPIPGESWVVLTPDSASSVNVFHDRRLIRDGSPSSETGTGGASARVLLSGKSVFGPALHVPDNPFNIVSVHRLCRAQHIIAMSVAMILFLSLLFVGFLSTKAQSTLIVSSIRSLSPSSLHQEQKYLQQAISCQLRKDCQCAIKYYQVMVNTS